MIHAAMAHRNCQKFEHNTGLAGGEESLSPPATRCLAREPDPSRFLVLQQIKGDAVEQREALGSVADNLTGSAIYEVEQSSRAHDREQEEHN
jgi:hypothetical protein